MYLEICFDYIDMLCSPSLDLRGRLVLASKVSFFFVYGNYGFTMAITRVVEF